jgi:hypothetical protein
MVCLSIMVTESYCFCIARVLAAACRVPSHDSGPFVPAFNSAEVTVEGGRL